MADKYQRPTTPKILTNPDISTNAKAVFALLAIFPDGLTKLQLSAYLGLGEKTIERAIRQLPWTAVCAEYNAGGRSRRQNVYRIPMSHRLQRNPSSDWGGIDRTTSPEHLADMEAPGPDDLEELMLECREK